MKSRVLAFVFAAAMSLPAFAASIPDPPAIDAKAYILVDYDSGEILAAKNPDERVEPASITKVMTTYIAFDEIKKGRLKPDDEVLISEKAWRQGIDSSQSRMFVHVGDRVKLMDLLRGIIIASGNDASVAVSEHIAGSESVFADLMNQYAQRLGMKNTHFVDASGMPDPSHYTTARDLGILARALIHDFPEYYPIFAEQEFKYGPVAAQPNRNLLLKKDPTIDGIKTGHTQAAGYCLLASAKRDDRRLISAVMGTKSWAYRENASLELLNYGFRFYETVRLFGKASPAGTVRIYKGAAPYLNVGTLEPVFLSLPRGARERITTRSQITGVPVAPVAEGQELGTVAIELDGQPLKSVPLVALEDIQKGSIFRRLIDQIRLWLM